MPNAERSVVDPPKEAKLRLIANAVPKRPLALCGQSIDDLKDELYLIVLI